MRVLVLGAGLQGLCTAYFLQHLGHDVTVADRAAAPAARLLGDEAAPGDATLSQPMPFDRLALAPAGVARPRLQRALRTWRTLALALRPSREREAARCDEALRQRRHSLATCAAMQEAMGWAPAPARRSAPAGLLGFYTDARAFAQAVQRAPRLRRLGAMPVLLTADEAVRVEPALAALRAELRGAAYLPPPEDGGDPAAFARELVAHCHAAGVRFLLRHTLIGLHEDQGRVQHAEFTGPDGAPRALRANAYVLALGDASAAQAAAVGVDIPVHAVRDYLVSFPAQDARRTHRMRLHDDARRLRFSRVAGPAGEEIVRVRHSVAAARPGLPPPPFDAQRFGGMVERVQTLFPGALDSPRARLESRTREQMAGGLPCVGGTRLPNLHLAATHGRSDWVHACGTGRTLAWSVSGLEPSIAMALPPG